MDITLNKAIELLQDLEHWSPELMKTDAGAAIRIGREAAKYVRSQYDPDHQMMRPLLPGEARE